MKPLMIKQKWPKLIFTESALNLKIPKYKRTNGKSNTYKQYLRANSKYN